MTPPRRHAFTLLELLVVLIGIVILAAIAVPNFLEAQTRSKIARTQTDQALLAASLGAYYADHRAWPANSPEVRAYFRAIALLDSGNAPTPADSAIPWNFGDVETNPRFRPFRQRFGFYNKGNFPPLVVSDEDLRPLTTPVAYLMHALPVDTFHNRRDNGYGYINFADIIADLGLTSLEVIVTSRWAATPPVVTPPNPALGDPFGFLPTFTPQPPTAVATSTPTTATATLAARSWVILSTGPSFSYTFSNPMHEPYTPYNPNNGTISAGEIWRTGD
jgi:type II secretory pathway pseudopilin PulG